MFKLETERLRLIPLNLENLLLLKEDRSLMEKKLGLNASQMIFDEEIKAEIADALNFWITQVSKHEEDYPWFTNWEIVLKEANHSIGGIGLSGRPNEKGEVTVGYVIDANFHGKGFAPESLGALAKWVFENPDVTAIVAETPKNNEASQKVLQKNGFVQTEETDMVLGWKLTKTEGYAKQNN